jgi:hypothetical protein
MFGIPLPWLLIGLTIALFGTYRGGYHFGWSDRDKEMQIQIAKKNEEARQTEQKLTEKLNETSTKLLETTNAVNQKQTALDRAIRAGRVRFPTASCPQTTANPTIAEIIAQGDKNTAALNACVDSYNQMRDLLNANNR